MIIYPTIELMGGKCVSLTRGRLNEPSIWHVDPIEKAKAYAQQGAEWLHVTDLDRLTDAETDNAELIEEMIRAVGIPVQLGGGLRSREHAEHWIDKGAGRVVIGTAAIQAPDMVKELAKYHPDQIAIAIDIYQGQLMSHGWQEASTLQAADVLHAFDGVPLAAVIITDIDADIEDSDGSLGVISGLANETRHPVIARGTVCSVDDVSRLKYVNNIAGTMIGRALMAHDVDLAEAISLAQPDLTPTADFI